MHVLNSRNLTPSLYLGNHGIVLLENFISCSIMFGVAGNRHLDIEDNYLYDQYIVFIFFFFFFFGGGGGVGGGGSQRGKKSTVRRNVTGLPSVEYSTIVFMELCHRIS